MKIWMYCQVCEEMCEVAIRPSVDAVFGDKQVRRCSTQHLVGAIQFTPDELGAPQ